MPGFPMRVEAEFPLVDEIRNLAADYPTGERLIADLLGWDHCPTVAELRALGRAGEREWRPVAPGKCRYGLCSGDGWQMRYALHTHESRPGAGVFVRREWISAAVYNELARKVDWQKQFVFTGVNRCRCAVAESTHA